MKRILRNIGIFCAVVVGTFILFVILLDSVIIPYIVDVPSVTVPDLHQQTLADAAQTLRRKGLRLAIDDSIYHDVLAPGIIVDQRPRAEQRIKKGRRVFIDVSRGARLYEVPRVIESSEREARLQLAGSQLRVGRVHYVSSGTVPKGAVLKQRPAAGRRLPGGSRVNLDISSGHPLDPKRVPDLIGLPIEAVEDTLAKYEMRRGVITERIDNTVPLGQVLSQHPTAAARQPRNTPIDLVVSVRTAGGDADH